MSTPLIETDRLVRTFIKMRAQKKKIKAAYVEEDEKLSAMMRRVENELLRRAQEQGMEGFKTVDGTTYIAEDNHASIADPDDFMEFVKETGDLYFYEQRPSLGHIKEYQKAHDGNLPPGVRMFREFRMRIRAAKKREDEDVD